MSLPRLAHDETVKTIHYAVTAICQFSNWVNKQEFLPSEIKKYRKRKFRREMISVFNTLHFKCIRDIQVEIADMSLNLTGHSAPVLWIFQFPLDESHQDSNMLQFLPGLTNPPLDFTSPASYHPTSLLFFIAKLLEIVV